MNKIHLKKIDSARLYNWLLEHREEAKTTPAKTLAERAGKDLGLTLTDNNISRLRFDMGLGREFVKKEKKAVIDVAAHEKIRVLAAALTSLIKGLGVTPCEELMELTK
jgi:hypothetical protein